MRCKEIRDLLSPYTDKMTNKQETLAVEAHLQACAHCREELDQLESLCHMMHELESPPLPDTIVQDLHQRLLAESIKNKPAAVGLSRKPKWIAAVAAALLMAVSIYASGLMPAANLALWFKAEEKEHKAPVVLEEPTPSWDNTDSGNEIDHPIDIADPEQDPEAPANNGSPVEADDISQPDTNNNPAQAPVSNVTPPPANERVPRIAQACSARVTVEDSTESLARIIQIADAGSGIEFVSTSNSSAQIMSLTNTREVVFKLEQSQLDSFLGDLGNLGTLSTPVYNETVLTEEYNSIENKINGLEQQIQTLESGQTISAEDQKRLNGLKQQLRESESQKSQLEKQLKTVNITIYLVETVNS